MIPRRKPRGCTFCPIMETSGRPLVHDYREMAGAFMDRRCMHMRARQRSLPGRPGVGGRAFDEQLVLIDVLLIARVGNRREQRLRDEARRFLGRELENRQRLIDLLADDQLAHKMQLARRDSDEAGSRYRFHDSYNFPAYAFAPAGAAAGAAGADGIAAAFTSPLRSPA